MTIDSFPAKLSAPATRFPPRTRALTKDELATHDLIMARATELEALIERKIKPGRYRALSITALEESIMWAIRELTT